MNGLPFCQNILRCILVSEVLEVKDIKNCRLVCRQFLMSSRHVDFWLKLCKRYSYFDKRLKDKSYHLGEIQNMFLCFYKNLKIEAPLMKDTCRREEFKVYDELYMKLFMFDVTCDPSSRSILLCIEDLLSFKRLNFRIKKSFRKEYQHVTFSNSSNFSITNQTLIIDNKGNFIDNTIVVPFLKRKRIMVVLHLSKHFFDCNNLILSWKVLRIVEIK